MLAIYFFVFGFLISGITAYISYSDKLEDYKQKKINSRSFKAIFIVAIIGALLTALTNVKSVIEKNESSKNARKLNDSLFTLNNSLREAVKLNLALLIDQKDSTSLILNSQQQLINANRDLNIANEKIINLQGSVISNLFGSGNIPNFIVFKASGDKFYRNLGIQILNEGNTPFRGLRASVSDIYSGINFNRILNQYESLGSNDSIVLFDRVKEMEKQIVIGDIPSKGGLVFYYVRLPRPVLEFGLTFSLTWDNGNIIFGFSGSYRDSDEFLTLSLDFVNTPNGKKLDSGIVKFHPFN